MVHAREEFDPYQLFIELFDRLASKNFKQEEVEHQLDFFTNYAQDQYKGVGYFVPIVQVKTEDFQNPIHSQIIQKWLRAVIPAVLFSSHRYWHEHSILMLKEIAQSKAEAPIIVAFISRADNWLSSYFSLMANGKKVNLDFVLALEKASFEILGLGEQFNENDVFANRRRLMEACANAMSGRSQPPPEETFEGVHYYVNPPVDYDFMEVELEEAELLGMEITEFDGINSTELEGDPVKIGEVLSQPSLVVPISLLSDVALKKLFKECFNVGDDNRQKNLKALIKSVFFRQDRWCLYLDGTTLRFLVPKETILLHPADPLRRTAHEH